MRTNEILHKPGAERKLWNADGHTRDLAAIIMTNVNGTSRESGIKKDSPEYNEILTKQIDKVIQMLRNDISNIIESDHAFAGFGYSSEASESKEITETSAEQYEVMLDVAGELGEQIASDAILDDHTEAWGQGLKRLDADEIQDVVNKHLTVAYERMINVAHRYIQRRLRDK